ncbi:MAG: hypothetical protein ACYS8Z_19955 [Planctomycetota bacterium]|jgi:hypothetical protein
MRTKKTCLLLLSWLVLVTLSAFTLSGEDYEISWYTIDGGGGVSQGGPYVLTGTVGQPDADWSKGGSYEVLGGYWAGGPLCVVAFDDFARFADYWWLRDSGADLNSDAEIDFADLAWFTDYWLSHCPHAWPYR